MEGEFGRLTFKSVMDLSLLDRRGRVEYKNTKKIQNLTKYLMEVEGLMEVEVSGLDTDQKRKKYPKNMGKSSQ